MDDPELPQVIVAHCGCVILAATPPVGYRFTKTALGDVRQPVFACQEHTRLTTAPPQPATRKRPKRPREARGLVPGPNRRSGGS